MLCLNERERELLFSGLPHSAIALYLWLRSRMTWSTCIVGDAAARVSWQAITEGLHVEWRPGPSNTGSPSVQQARRIARHLVRAGLVRMRSRSAHKELIFECVLATVYNSAQNQPDSIKRRQPDSTVQREKHRQPDSTKNRQPDTHLDFVGTGGTPKRAREKSPVDKSERGELVFPAACSSQENHALRALIGKSNLNGSAQPVLDELQALHDRNGVCRNAAAYVRSLIRACERGEYHPSNAAMEIARARARKPADVQPHNVAPQTAPTSSRKKARAELAKIAAAIRPGGLH